VLSRVIIGLDAGGSASWRELDATTLVVDIPGGMPPTSLLRPLDTSSFDSPVSGVKARGEPWGCRVEVHLSRHAPWSVSRVGDHLVLDVASVLHAPAPTGAPPLAGAYTQEVLIDAKGRTHDPGAYLFAGAGPGSAWDAVADTASSTAPTISMDLVNADIHHVLRLFGDVGRVNVVAGDDVQGKVTVHLESVPWDQALAAVLASQGLAAQRFGGNIVSIRPVGK